MLPVQSWAHSVGQSYVFLSLFEHSIEGRVEIPVRNLNQALDLDLKTDGTVSAADLESQIEPIQRFVLDHLDLYPQDDSYTRGEPEKIEIVDHGLLNLSFGQIVSIGFRTGEMSNVPRMLEVDYRAITKFDAEHRSLLVIENSWRTGTFNNEAEIALYFTPEETRQRLDLGESNLYRGFIAMVESGAHHIAIGIDHILFILALLISSVMQRDERRWQPVARFRSALLNVVKVVTLFTIAHTITLSLATLEIFTLPGRLVESVIALSIILVALDIIFPLFKQKIWLVVFTFGLFHGFGFASVLLDLGINGGYTFLTLFGFNLGVELGQLVIVLVAFPLLYLIRKIPYYARIAMPGGAAVLIIVAGYWFIERAFNVDLPAGELLFRFTGLFL